MLECIVLGDSIASGVGGARPECVTTARVGITSGTYINELFPLAPHSARSAVISLGVNDDVSMDTVNNLRQVRGSLSVGSVVWLLPGLKENVRAAIRTVAAEYGDGLVDTRPQVGPDHLHPSGAGYRVIAGETLNGSDNAEVAFAPVPLPANGRMPEGQWVDSGGWTRSAAGSSGASVGTLGGNLSRYRLHVVFRGRLQQMAALRLQLAHQQNGYTKWPAANVTYGALPPPGYAYGALPGSTPGGSTPGTARSAVTGTATR